MGFGGGSAGLAGVNPVYVLLDSHTATGAESTYTFTPASAITSAVYSSIRILYEICPTASNILSLRLNGDATANYNYGGFRNQAATLTAINATAQTSIQLASATMFLLNNPTFGFVDIFLVPAIGTDAIAYPCIQTHLADDTSVLITESLVSQLAINSASITSITTFMAVSSWVIGSKIWTYGTKRA